MTNIRLIKIGLENYQGGPDKNSGLHEYYLIKNALNNICSKDAIVIINGKFGDVLTEDYLLDVMQNYKYRIFVATDEIAFTENDTIIKNCTHLLHQAYAHRFNYDIPQYYSYVPELFYKDNPLPQLQDDLLFYGGGTRGNKQLINAYSEQVACYFILKTDTEDNRIDYDKFMQEQQLHKFSLIVSRNKYKNWGWCTSRFVEALSNWSYPVVDKDYDKYNWYRLSWYPGEADIYNKCTPNTIKEKLQYLVEHEEKRLDMLKFYRDMIKHESGFFKETVEKIINGQI